MSRPSTEFGMMFTKLLHCFWRVARPHGTETDRTLVQLCYDPGRSSSTFSGGQLCAMKSLLYQDEPAMSRRRRDYFASPARIKSAIASIILGSSGRSASL